MDFFFFIYKRILLYIDLGVYICFFELYESKRYTLFYFIFKRLVGV